MLFFLELRSQSSSSIGATALGEFWPSWSQCYKILFSMFHDKNWFKTVTNSMEQSPS
jgi:hypothetical protein